MRALWDKDSFRALTDSEKLGYMLFATGPATTTSGLYRATLEGLAAEAGWPPKRLSEVAEALQASGLVAIDWGKRLVMVVDAVTNFPPANPSVLKGWAEDARLLPDCEVKSKWVRLVRESAKAEWVDEYFPIKTTTLAPSPDHQDTVSTPSRHRLDTARKRTRTRTRVKPPYPPGGC